MKFKKFVELGEQTPYDGSHIGHKSSLLHIKQVYGNKYKMMQKGDDTWEVHAMVGATWVPVTTPMKKEHAQKFMKWLQDADSDKRQMVGTIDGQDKRLNEKEAPHDKRDKADVMRSGVIEYEAPGFGKGKWVRDKKRVTIKPGQSVKAFEKQLSKEMKKNVRLYIPDF